jgi:hypothetical protein
VKPKELGLVVMTTLQLSSHFMSFHPASSNFEEQTTKRALGLMSLLVSNSEINLPSRFLLLVG